MTLSLALFLQITYECWLHVHAAQKQNKTKKQRKREKRKKKKTNCLRIPDAQWTVCLDNWSPTTVLEWTQGPFPVSDHRHSACPPPFPRWPEASQNPSPVESHLGDNGLASLKQTDSTHTHIWSHWIESLTKSYKRPQLFIYNLTGNS